MLADRGDPGPDLLDFGGAELGVQSECLLPVVASLPVLAHRVVTLGEVAVRARLLVSVAGFGCQPGRCGQLGAGGSGPAAPVQGLGQESQRHGLAELVAGLPEQGESLPEMADGLPVFASAHADVAEITQSGGYSGRVIDAAVDRQGLSVEAGGLRQLAAAEVELADPRQRVGLEDLVIRLAEHRQGTPQVLRRLVVAAQLGLDGGLV
jgi:hypothetical protein